MEKITLGYAIAFFVLMLVASIVTYAIRTAECYEQESDVFDISDMEQINYKGIVDSERPYIENQYN